MAKKEEKVAETKVTKEKTSAGFKIRSVANRQARTVNLGQFNTVRLSAEIEIVFDQPQDPDSQIVKDAFAKMRELNKAEWNEQMAPYREAKKKAAEKKAE